MANSGFCCARSKARDLEPLATDPGLRRMNRTDQLITAFDHGLRTLFAPAHARRAEPGADLPEAELADRERDVAAALMRVNHTGEVCAQALYQGQMLAVRDPRVRHALASAAQEETDHLAWTQSRISALGGRRSVLDPVFYAGSFAMGLAAGLLGDRWNLGFLAETERQVESHLSEHLERLPAGDQRSRAVVEQMRADESRHARGAVRQGGADLPGPVKSVMRAVSKAMTGSTYYV